MKKIMIGLVAVSTVAVTTALLLKKRADKKNHIIEENVEEVVTETTENDAVEEVEETIEETTYEITVEFCPRLEDGETCKTVHDAPLDMFEYKVITIPEYREFTSWTSNDGEDMYIAIIESLESMTEFEFTVDFMGFEFSRPILMGHFGNDPKNSIIVRIHKYKVEK